MYLTGNSNIANEYHLAKKKRLAPFGPEYLLKEKPIGAASKTPPPLKQGEIFTIGIFYLLNSA
jgi:hypothetical protein